MAYLATSSHEDALDIVQEAMLKLCKNYSGREDEELSMIFSRILQNQIRDWYRREKVRGVFSFLLGNSKESDQETPDPITQFADERLPNSEVNLAHQQAITNLETAIQQLPLRQKQTFLLRFWEGFNVEETAKIMACSEGSVKTHYARAKQSLRKSLGEYF